MCQSRIVSIEAFTPIPCARIVRNGNDSGIHLLSAYRDHKIKAARNTSLSLGMLSGTPGQSWFRQHEQRQRNGYLVALLPQEIFRRRRQLPG